MAPINGPHRRWSSRRTSWGRGKTTTHDIERHHGRQRHWFGRVTRQSIMVSKSTEMVDLTMALLAKVWVNENQDALLSRLG